MPVVLITGPTKAGKERAMLDAVRAHRARGERPLLVVPAQVDVERCERELCGTGRAEQVRAVRFDGLIAEVVRRSGSPAPDALGALARERVLASLAGRHGRGVARALGSLLGELRVRRVTPERFCEALAAWSAADPAARARARVLGELYERYARTLDALGRSDPEQRAVSALDALRVAPARWGATPVVLHGFDDYTALQLDAIETLGAVVGADVTVTFAFERGRDAFAGRARTFQTLRALAAAHRELDPPSAERDAPSAGAVLRHLERNLFERAPAAPVPAAGALRLLEGRGERDELELVAGEIAALLARGVGAAEIALVHRAPETIAELLEEVLVARGVPFAMTRRVRFADTAIGGALLAALRAASEPDAEIEHLLRWLRVADGNGLARADALEARARRAGAGTVAEGCALWDAASPPRETLRALADLRSAAGAGARALIARTVEELERLAAHSPLLEVSPREARAVEVGRDALIELRRLADDPGSGAVPDLLPDGPGLIATLRGLEFAIETGVPAPRARETVAVLDPFALRTRSVRALFLCGLQEDVFPAPPRPAPLLSDEDRRRLVESSGLLALAGDGGADALAAERYLFYTAISRPRELLALSWHDADDDGLGRSRSLFVDDVCDLFACDLHAARVRSAPGAVGEVEEGEGEGRAQPAQRIAALRDARVLAELGGQRIWSASALEAWAGCPMRWFVERLLVARDLEPEPEQLARGALAHAALRDVLDGLRRETGSARPRPAILARARELLHAALDEHERAHPLSVAPERVPGVRRRLEADLERYLEHAAAQRSPLEPAHTELSFGFPEEPGGLPALELGDGIRVRGRIDRVDVDPDGAGAVVYDYKGARALDGARWARERSFQVPLYMRAVENAGERVVGGFYQPLSGRDLRARGALDAEAGIALEVVRGDAREGPALQELVEEALDAAREAAAQARAGELEARPATCGFGDGGCLYPEICRCET